MESQPQNPKFRNNPENFHPCNNEWHSGYQSTVPEVSPITTGDAFQLACKQ